QDKKVGVIAIDPTSPFTGGALLGDRIRMGDLSTDSGVFIRSMATRGSLGGLCERSQEVADLMDGFGFEIVMIETVGVGQSELEIVEAADTTIVALVPESGDSIQAMKAGLMEIADVFVLNKSDREGADRFLTELESILDFADENKRWKPPIVQTIANSGEGITDLQNEIENHLQYLKTTDILRKKKRKRIENYIRRLIREKLLDRFWQPETVTKLYSDLDKIMQKDISPYKLTEILIAQFLENQK
ncbi:methylmalonyl Co-A mutase-associated GTPase MeaB, partial [candidate division KSB1 bacterium]|nr:methylmalonyl Co-A mutase-associated GTPase MeaB [candidate division KSB1 bacterium]